MERTWLHCDPFLGICLSARYSENLSGIFIVDSFEKLDAVKNNPNFFYPLPITEELLIRCGLIIGKFDGYFYYREKDLNIELRYRPSRNAVRIRGENDFVGESVWCFSFHEMQLDVMARGGALLTLSEMNKTRLGKSKNLIDELKPKFL